MVPTLILSDLELRGRVKHETRHSFIMQINQQDVLAFKTKYCNENRLISSALLVGFDNWIDEPLLDVGSGLGDISTVAFPHRRVYLLDRLDYSSFKTLPRHRRVTEDFFAFKPEAPVRTALFSHVLQFLDEDVGRLLDAVRALHLRKVITVTNDNTGVLGEVVNWARNIFPDCNPEMGVHGFPPDSKLERSTDVTAKLSCANFDVLAEQTCFMLDMPSESLHRDVVAKFLRTLLPEPNLCIQQSISAYAVGEIND